MSNLLIDVANSRFVDAASASITEGGSLDSDIDKQPKLKSTGVIDVVNHFNWYAGPKATTKALDKIPSVYMVEREQKLSSLIQGALYYVNAVKGMTGGEADLLGGIESLAKKATTFTDAVAGDDGIGSLLKTVNKGVQSFAGTVRSAGSRLSNGQDSNLLASHNLNSLNGIYFTEETGFNYRLPHYEFTKDVAGGGGAWGADPGSPILSKLLGAATEIVDNISGVVNVAAPGVYIEKPKFFQTADAGPTQTVTFPLINTFKRGAHSPIQQNYELLWLLAFQNKPYKTSFARTPPPKIYSIACPGQFAYPYAYISNMSIDFQGTIRNQKVSVPSGDGSTLGSTVVSVPVPEAYMVSITFTSLIADYGNVMISQAQNTSKNGNKIKFGA